MFTKTLIACAMMAGAAQAQTDAQIDQYQNWSAVMGLYGYDWKPYEIATEDGFTLTLMNVLGSTQAVKGYGPEVENSKVPILVTSIFGWDPYQNLFFFMNIPDGQLSPLLKLHEDGHDLWFLYDRSSEYARHQTLSKED